jgi:4-hydroxy-tetrahydrodipicolinate reductase
MKEIKAIVVGAGGKMGGRIIHIIRETPSMRLARAVERPDHLSIGMDIGDVIGLGKMGVILEGSLKKGEGDVIINFSSPKASIESLEFAKEAGLAIVIGTTGFTADEMAKIKELAAKTRCVLAPNMSVGVNVMFKVLEYVTGIIGEDFDVEIIEAHHNLKKDAPSGTAMRMAQIIAATLKRDLDKEAVYERKGMIGARTKSEIGIQTIRAGDIVGEHWIIYGGLGERLEFIHRAHSRDNFAKGVVRAAKWIVGQPNGFYDMQDVLGLKK